MESQEELKHEEDESAAQPNGSAVIAYLEKNKKKKPLRKRTKEEQNLLQSQTISHKDLDLLKSFMTDFKGDFSKLENATTHAKKAFLLTKNQKSGTGRKASSSDVP